MSLWETYLRWRHSKGFGVHSPYAYRFITDVLRPGPCGYYSYWKIDEHLKGGESNDYPFLRLIKFTVRLANFLNSKRLVISGECSRLAEVTAKSMGLDFVDQEHRKDFEFSEKDLLIVEKNSSDIFLLQKALDNYIPVFVINPDREVSELLDKPIDRGLLLKGKDRIILIPRQEMEYVAYDIKLNLRYAAG